jgi:hypothetical protein
MLTLPLEIGNSNSGSGVQSMPGSPRFLQNSIPRSKVVILGSKIQIQICGFVEIAQVMSIIAKITDFLSITITLNRI